LKQGTSSIVILLFAMIFLVGCTIGDFKLNNAEVRIVENPSITIGRSSPEGEEPVEVKSKYLEYKFTITNTTYKQYGDSNRHVDLKFISKSNNSEVFEKEIFRNNPINGKSGPGFFEASKTEEFIFVYVLSDNLEMDIAMIEEQALIGDLILSLNGKVLRTFKLSNQTY
jgi:hypothetical protein